MIDGIVRAIQQAHDRLQEGHLILNQGQLLDTNINRSPAAYLLNPAKERASYPYDVDKDMVLLGFFGASGSGLGLLNWYSRRRRL